MSPEQVKGDKSIDHRSDIYSLGVTMFFVINGKPPYNSDTDSQFDIFTKIVYEALPEFSTHSIFKEILLKACQKNREERFQSCSDYLEEFKLTYTNMLGNNENTKVNRGGEELRGSDTIVKVKTKTELNKNKKKSKSTLFNFIRILSIILLISSFIALAGTIQQYVQFEKSKDLMFYGPWSGGGAIITGVLSLISVVYFLIKKTGIIKSSISLIVSALAILVVSYTHDNYSSFWKPYWEWETYIDILDISEEQKNTIEEGWRQGNISIDSLHSLKETYNNVPDSIPSN